MDARVQLISRLLVILVAIVLSSLPARAALAESHARILDTHPSDGAILRPGEAFYVRIEYATDEPITLWARPYFEGRPIEKAMSNASAQYAGTGEALGWFALTQAGAVDEVRVLAGGGTPYREWELARVSLSVHFMSAGASTAAAPAWVRDLTAAADARQREEMQRRASEPASSSDVALFSGFMLLMLALIVAGGLVPLWSAWRWRGGWRVVAAIPVAAMALVVVRILIDTARDPTLHNLWPFEIVMGSAGSLVFIGVLKAARRLLGARP